MSECLRFSPGYERVRKLAGRRWGQIRMRGIRGWRRELHWILSNQGGGKRRDRCLEWILSNEQFGIWAKTRERPRQIGQNPTKPNLFAKKSILVGKIPTKPRRTQRHPSQSCAIPMQSRVILSSATLIDGRFGTANDGGFLLSSPPFRRQLYFAFVCRRKKTAPKSS